MQSTPHPQALAASEELAAELARSISGEVRLDQLTRQLYSTDASTYQVMPVGVVIPRDADDVAAAVSIAGRHQIPVIPRGGGTSLSGQTIGPGLIIDHSRWLDGILDLNLEERWVRVQSGLVLDQLNAALRPHGLMVGPDPASSMAATLGGMTGNNSTGTHSIVYGMMVDHVREVEVVLADGSQAHFGPQTPDAVAALARLSNHSAAVYRAVPRLIEQYQAAIESDYPAIWRNVAGYNLNRMLREQQSGQPFNLASLIVGSEGTLAAITSIKLNVVQRPSHTALMVLHFDELRATLESVPLILEHDPSAVELMDRFFIRLTRAHAAFGPRLAQFVDGDPRMILIVEFSGDSDRALQQRMRDLAARLQREGHCKTIIYRTSLAEIATVWLVRKAGLGLLLSQRGDTKPLTFVDDATVPIDQLADYAEEVERVCTEVGTEAAFYAHASAGCLHINPLVNLKTSEGLNQMQVISQAVARLAIAHGGTTTGEHGEGLARSYFNEQLYGPRLHQAFRELKGLFDPTNLFNPGKIIDGPAPWTADLLRFNPAYSAPYAPTITFLDFSADGGFGGMVEMCNGQGVCRKQASGAMCPSFMATRDEQHSTRGRANALRAAMTGGLGPTGMVSQAVHETLDLCLECKACKRECPSLVDMAKLKYEFLAQYQAVHGVPLRSRLFAQIAVINRLGSLAPWLVNWVYRQPGFRWLLDRTLGIDRRRTLPPLAAATFQRWFHRRQPPMTAPRGAVVLWDDTYLSYNEPAIGQAAVRVLEAAGFKVVLVTNRRCCGRPMISKGLLAEARQSAQHNVELLAPYAAAGVPILGLEPSCIATFRDEYPDLLKSAEARLVAQHSFFIEEFLLDLATRGELELQFAAPATPRHVLVHAHCYQKALIGSEPLLAVLRLLPNTTVEEILSGCCGMAGSFGYEREHYAVSLACGEDRLFPAVRQAAPASIISAAGISCRQQISHATNRQAVHPLIILAEALKST